MKPNLDDLRIASPCNVPWETMSGDDRTRFCSQCSKNVYNLSAMSRDKAEKFVAENILGRTDDDAGKPLPCIQFYRRADGTILTEDCPVGLRRIRRVALRMKAAAIIVFAPLISMFKPACAQPPPEIDKCQGDVSTPAMRGKVAPAYFNNNGATVTARIVGEHERWQREHTALTDKLVNSLREPERIAPLLQQMEKLAAQAEKSGDYDAAAAGVNNVACVYVYQNKLTTAAPILNRAYALAQKKGAKSGVISRIEKNVKVLHEASAETSGKPKQPAFIYQVEMR